MQYNQVILMGRATANPELKTVKDSDLVVFRIAAGTIEHPLFIEVNAWGRRAINCANYLKKGMRVLVSGELRMNNFETKDGKKVTKYFVLANYLNVIDRADAESWVDELDIEKNLIEGEGIDLDNVF